MHPLPRYGHAVMVLLMGSPVLPLAAQAPRPSAHDSDAIAIEDVRVIDVTDGHVAAPQTIVIRGSRITYVGDARSARVPKGARVVDARDEYVIPGLWDMHSHLISRAEGGEGDDALPLVLAAGVTGTREMGSPIADFVHRRQRVAAHELPPVRYVAAGPILEGHATTPQFIEIRTAEQARTMVDSLHALGVDFIKFYQGLPRDAFLAIMDEAHRQGLRTAGHPPIAARSVVEVSDLGATSLEHLWGMRLAGSPREPELRAWAAHLADTATKEAETNVAQLRIEAIADSTFDERRFDTTAAHLARNGTFITPTTVWHRMRMAFLAGDSTGGDPAHWADLPPSQRRAYAVYRAAMPRPRPGVLPATARIERVVAPLARAGVRFLVGTDGAPVPGFAVHREMENLVQDGLTPLQALQGATINGAIALGTTDSLGTIAAGKLADMVLLDANPLADIHNIERVRGVVANGRYFDRTALDRLITATAHGTPITADTSRRRDR